MYLYLVIFICLVLAVFTVWKESRGGGPRLVWRIVASLVAVASLACIALPLSYQGEEQLTNSEAALLTDGFNPDSLNSLKNDSILTADPAIKKQYGRAKLITLDQLKSITPAITRLHIFGYGLSKDEINQLDSIPVVFHAAPKPPGISAINWTDRLKQGQALQVQGTFNNTSGKLVRLLLKGLNTTVDSIVIAPQTEAKFSLTDLPKNIGQSVYHLVAVGEKDSGSGESLPIIIEPVKPLKILLLAASPGFENKFLKNWLSDNGFAVAMRSAISKDKFSSSYVNIEQLPLSNLTPSLMDKFDVVISDLSAIHSLNGTESAVLKQQLTQRGLGLIVRADTTFTTALWVQNGFPVKKPLAKDVKASSLTIGGKKIAAKLSSEPLYLNYQDGTQTLVNDEQNRLLAGLTIAGGGKIVFTTLNDTYSWALNGNKNDYADFWSLLIGKAARSVPQSQLWQTTGSMPTVNEPTQLQLETAGQVGQISVDSIYTSAKQNELIPYQWQATWWPVSPGWHNPKINGGSLPGAVYVYDANGWKTIKAIGKISQTKKYAEVLASANNVTKQIHQKISIPVPKGYFYVLLLAASVWLWIEGKVGGKSAQ